MKAYHTSLTRITYIKNNPMWFTDNIEYAKAYHQNTKDDHYNKAYTYEFELSGNILTYRELIEKCKFLDIDVKYMVTELVCNPDDIFSDPNVQKIAKLCDGFYHDDYDPRDNQKDIETILIFKPKLHAKMISKKSLFESYIIRLVNENLSDFLNKK